MFRIALLLALAANLGQAREAEGWARFLGEKVEISDVQLAPDGDLVVLGELEDSEDTLCDAWVAKVDAAGEIVWQKCYDDGHSTLTASSIQPTRDGGYLLVGEIGDPDEEPGVGGWAAKLDPQGGVEWEKGYHIPSAAAVLGAVQETERGYIALGRIEPEDGADRAWIVGLDLDGNVVWQKTYGTPDAGSLPSVLRPARDGDFLVAGSAGVAGKGEAWLLKLDADGNSLWQKTYGGPEENIGGTDDLFIATDVRETDGGYLMAGSTFDLLPEEEDGPDLPDFRSRAWIARLDRDGRVQWRRIYGEAVSFAQMLQIHPTPDGGMLALGAGGELGRGRGSAVWLARLDADGNILWQRLYGEENFEVFLLPLQDGRLVLAGASFLNDRGGDWLLKLEADGSLPGCGLEKPVAITSKAATLTEREFALSEVGPSVTTLDPGAVMIGDRSVPSLPACPLAWAFGSCRQIQAAGKSYGTGTYPVALKGPEGPELLGAFCEMEAFGGGWMLIAARSPDDPRPPSDFVRFRFGEYHEGSFSIWPAVDWSATSGKVGLSWVDEDFQIQASLLEDLTPEQLQAILGTHGVEAWVR